MPRKASVTRGRILDAATALVREEGHERLTARALAVRLGCSTQPILYCFTSMNDLVCALYQRIDTLHSQTLMAGLEQADDPMLQLGLNYVQFAQDEPAFFRFLFQSNGLGEQNMTQLLDAPDILPMIGLLGEEAHVTPDQARQAFFTLFACAHGLASMLANNALSLDEQTTTQTLSAAFIGSIATAKGEDQGEDNDEPIG